MKRILRTWTSAWLVMALLVSLLPPMTAFAAVTLEITNLTVNSSTSDAAPDNDADVIRVTANPISVAVTINGIAAENINSIYYEITNVNTNITSINKTNKPVAINANEISFNNVTLPEGLNKIIIKYGETSVVSSRAGWAYFTPVTNISNLKFNGEEFEDGGMYPKTPPYTGLSVSGVANNSNQIETYYNGKLYGPTVFNRGEFTYITNTNRSTDLTFDPGDNEIKMIAKNNTNSYVLERSFVYDNGRAFPYNLFIDNVPSVPPTTPNPRKLIGAPTISGASLTQVNVSGLLKMPVTVSNSVYYDYALVYVNSSSGSTNNKYRYDFNVGRNYVVNGSTETEIGVITPNSAHTITGKQRVYDFNHIFAINSGSKLQEFNVDFYRSGSVVDSSSYTFYVVDPSTAYVESVDYMINSTAKLKLNEAGTTQINSFPATFQVNTNSQAQSVRIEMDGKIFENTVDPITNADGDVIGGRAAVKLEGITDGVKTMKVTPYKSADYSNPSSEGIKSYAISVSAAPYVIVNHIYNGQVFSKKEFIGCGVDPSSSTNPKGNYPAPCFTGRLVNLPQSEMSKVNVTLNGIPLTIDIDTDETSELFGTFVIRSSNFTGTPPTRGAAADEMDKNGKKTLKFSIQLSGKPVTETSYDIFILSDHVPSVLKLEPRESVTGAEQFKKTADDTYVTLASNVTFDGIVRNSSQSAGTGPQYSIKYRVPGETTQRTVPITNAVKVNDPGDLSSTPNFNESFTAVVPEMTPGSGIALENDGDYYFELTASNSSGIITTKTIKITKEVQPYVIKSPQLIKNAEGKDQANINANFQNIVIEANKADSVVFGKEEARKNGSTFTYEAKDLKPGKNEIKFTVNRGTAKTNGSIILFHVNTPLEGAMYKSILSSNMKVFDGDIELKFPKDTKLMRNDRNATKQYVSTNRKLLFGIADIDTGQVDKLNGESPSGQFHLNGSTERNRFKAASKLYWIDAGTIRDLSTIPGNRYQEKLKDALEGSGTIPVPTNVGVTLPEDMQPAFYSRDLSNLVVPTKRVTLTLKYDPYIRDDAWKYVTVFQFNRFEDMTGGGFPEQGWRNIGGIVDTKKNTITVEVESFGYFQVMYMNDSFEDVTNHPWARNELDTLYSKGMMKNKDPGGRFLPNDAISRGEFVTMLVKIFDIPLKNSDTISRVNNPNDPNYRGTFADVQRGYTIPNSNGLYDFMHIEAAARAGIVRGTSQGLFLPGNVITRQDAAVMIARAADLKIGTDDKKLLDSLNKTFTDSSTIDYYARGAVEAVNKAGFIQGKPNEMLPGQKQQTIRFDPTDNFTRAEASAVAMRVLQQLKKVPK
ncbi:S-layer homology domain-containing protein [Paenibacillus sp. GD4]|uniref:S-layer homology domain-containing protein n=1 Tax=Paenibacillus sp. GD4 TaxID=3068890 RepID=UPI00279659D4|nr:S-layer homology domain-containing protein [Paenibacillus sp. GD4]MDQ1911262.1 S-layer homology domain-containing protein [Paenibacillus sp. GD4]